MIHFVLRLSPRARQRVRDAIDQSFGIINDSTKALGRPVVNTVFTCSGGYHVWRDGRVTRWSANRQALIARFEGWADKMPPGAAS